MTAVLARKTSTVADLLQRAAREGPAWARALAEAARSRGLPETEPEAVRRLIRSSVLRMEHGLAEANEAQGDRVSCATRLRRLRADRESARAALYDTLVRFRRVAGLLVDDGLAVELFPPGKTPREPGALLEAARRVVERLEALEPSFGDGEPKSLDFDAAAFGTFLRSQASDLEDALRSIGAVEQARSRAVSTRDRRLARLDETVRAVRHLFTGLSLLAR